VISLRGAAKRYGAVEALTGVDLDIAQGDVLGICGDNGAGKSTLIRIISGAQEPSAGTMSVRGAEVRFHSPHDAYAAGIATIYQDLALSPSLAIWQNVFLGAELTRFGLLDKARMRTDAASYMARLGVSISDMDAPVANLSGGQRQAVAIARIRLSDAKVVLLDEPTAAISVRQVGEVLNLIRRLREQHIAVVLISHRMQDVFAVADRIVVLRRGSKVADKPIAQSSPEEVTGLITGAIETA